jgi:hypothetical protein
VPSSSAETVGDVENDPTVRPGIQVNSSILESEEGIDKHTLLILATWLE